MSDCMRCKHKKVSIVKMDVNESDAELDELSSTQLSGRSVPYIAISDDDVLEQCEVYAVAGLTKKYVNSLKKSFSFGLDDLNNVKVFFLYHLIAFKNVELQYNTGVFLFLTVALNSIIMRYFNINCGYAI